MQLPTFLQLHILKGKMFVWGPNSIGYIDLLAPSVQLHHYHVVEACSNIKPESSIVPCDGGWLFVSSDSNHAIKYFSFETMTITQLASRCSNEFGVAVPSMPKLW